MKTPNTRNARHGFTLVELLVVIGIIALLIGILLPTLSRAQGSAKKVVCLSNQRQVGTLLVMYTNENQYRMPVTHYYGGREGSGPAVQWDFGLPDSYNDWQFTTNNGPTGAREGYGMNFFGGLLAMGGEGADAIGDALVCPEADISRIPDDLEPGQPITNYLVNANFPNRKITEIKGSSEYAVLQDNIRAFENSYTRPLRSVQGSPVSPPYHAALLNDFKPQDWYRDWANVPGSAGAIATYGNVHDGGGVFLMADGSGIWIDREATTARLFGFFGDGAGLYGTAEDRYEESLGKRYRSIFDYPEQ